MNPAWEPEKAEMSDLRDHIMSVCDMSDYDHSTHMAVCVREVFTHNVQL